MIETLLAIFILLNTNLFKISIKSIQSNTIKATIKEMITLINRLQKEDTHKKRHSTR